MGSILVGIVMGSDSDWPVMRAAAEALDEFDVDNADPASALAHRRHQPHRAGIGSPQEAGRNRNRLNGSAVGGASGVGAQRNHRPAVHLGPDGPVLVQLALENAVHAVSIDFAERHRGGE